MTGSVARRKLRAPRPPFLQLLAPAVPAKPDGGRSPRSLTPCSTFDKAALRPKARLLDDVAAKAKQLKIEVILAVGHTDRIGDAHNQKFPKSAPPPSRSTYRQGIEANRVYTEGKGREAAVTGDKCRRWRRVRQNKKLVECRSRIAASISKSSAPSNPPVVLAEKPCPAGLFSFPKQITQEPS